MRYINIFTAIFSGKDNILLTVIAITLFIANGVVGSLLIQSHSPSELKESVPKINANVPSITAVPTQPRQRIELVKKEEQFKVTVKENPENKRKSDIYLKDINTDEEIFFMTLDDVYRNHYHQAEYHNGNVYILIRPGGEYYYQKDPNWTTELWRYDEQKKGEKLFSNKGIDFRVSDDEQVIAINAHDKFHLMNKNGQILRTFDMIELEASEGLPKNGFLGFEEWGIGSIWLDNAGGPSLTGFVKVDLNTYEIEKYDLLDLDTGVEYTLNIEKELVAFTNYPPIFDEGGREQFLESEEKVNLVIYNLSTKEQQIVATSTTSQFRPRWLDDNTLEYNNPNGEGKMEYTVPQ